MSTHNVSFFSGWCHWFKFALQNTLRNRRRSAVTVSIAALGTAAILLAGGFALFTYESLAQAAARDTGHLVLGTPASFTTDEDVPLQHGLGNVDALRQQLLADPAVRQVLPKVVFSGLISNGDKSTVMMATGVDPDNEFAVKGPFLTVTAGSVLTSDSNEPSAGPPQGGSHPLGGPGEARVGGHSTEVMLGEALARSLKATPGSSLTLLASTTEGAMNAMDVVVKGTFTTGVPDMDKRAVFTSVALAQRLLVTDRVSSLGVFLDRMESTLPAQSRVAALHPELTVQNWEQQAVFYQAVKGLYNRIFGALGIIIGVIVVFVVTNAMAMAIIERTREMHAAIAIAAHPGAGGHVAGRCGRAGGRKPVAGRVGAAVCGAGRDATPPRALGGLPAEHRHRPHVVPGHAAGHGRPDHAGQLRRGPQNRAHARG